MVGTYISFKDKEDLHECRSYKKINIKRHNMEIVKAWKVDKMIEKRLWYFE